MAPALSVGVIFRGMEEKIFNKFVKVRDKGHNVFVKSFQSRSGLSALLKISAKCRRQMQLNRRLVQNDRRLPDQNRIAGI